MPSINNAKNLLTFALLLVVPAAMTGCNTLADNQAECDDDVDPYCEDDDGSSLKIKTSSKSKSSGVFKGFGSSGKAGSGG